MGGLENRQGKRRIHYFLGVLWQVYDFFCVKRRIEKRVTFWTVDNLLSHSKGKVS